MKPKIQSSDSRPSPGGRYRVKTPRGNQLGNAAVGAVIGGVVAGPVGAVAGAVVGAGVEKGPAPRKRKNSPKHRAKRQTGSTLQQRERPVDNS